MDRVDSSMKRILFALWTGTLMLQSPTWASVDEGDLVDANSIWLLLLLLLSARLQTPTDRAKCHKPEGTSREGNPKKEKINKNEGKKDKNTI